MDSELVIFSQLFIEAAVLQDERKIGKEDIVITNTQCKP